MNESSKKKARERCGVSSAYFQGIMRTLRERGIVVNNTINKSMIPNLDDSGEYKAMFVFRYGDKTNNKDNSEK